MHTIEIQWRRTLPVSSAEFLAGINWAHRHGYPVYAWPDTDASGRPVVMTRVTTPDGYTVALYVTDAPELTGSADPVTVFLSARPHYNPAHVAEIARACAADGIPFCLGCADWHRPADPHTED